MRIRLLFGIINIFFILPIIAQNQSQFNVQHYTEDDGLSQRYVTQIDQGDDGFIWIGTWNGLNRFDGYDFVNFKSFNSSGDHLSSDRIVNIAKNSKGDLWCLIDDVIYLFDTKNYKFQDVLSSFERKIHKSLSVESFYPLKDGTTFIVCKDGSAVSIVDSLPMQSARLCDKSTFVIPDYLYANKYSDEIKRINKDALYSLTDRGGNEWVRSNYGLYKLTPIKRMYKTFPQEKPSQIRCLFIDKNQNIWVTSKEDKTIRLFDKSGNLKGYLGSDGIITSGYTSFGASAYTVFQDHNNSIWLGCKPEGLYKLNEVNGKYKVSHIINGMTSELLKKNYGIYDIKEDKRGRLWIVTFGKGLQCLKPYLNKYEDITEKISNFPKEVYKIRNILITDDQKMFLASTEGLIIADVSNEKEENIHFNVHRKESDRAKSLNNNATMYVFKDSKGTIYVCTESGGLNRIDTKNVLSNSLDFTHFDTSTGLSTDITLSVVEYQGYLWIVGNNKIIRFNPKTHKSETFDNQYFRADFRFSDAIPLLLTDNRWLFGLQDGAITINLASLKKSNFIPNIALTGISIQNSPINLAVNHLSTVVLQPGQSCLTINFSALDYADNRNLEYAFSIDGDEWNYLGKKHSVTLLNLKPGEYFVKIKSTNHDGLWVDNTRELKILVEPEWWETNVAKASYIILLLTFIYIVIYVVRYIHIIKMREKNLEAYLSLIENNDSPSKIEEEDSEFQILERAQIKAVDNAFMKRILAFVEQHISDSEVNISDMADAAATSKAGLNRKMKAILGITPNEFLREVRIQKACSMLKDPAVSINDVAFFCGFSDSKYFSRAFKSKKNMTPSEYRTKNMIDE